MILSIFFLFLIISLLCLLNSSSINHYSLDTLHNLGSSFNELAINGKNNFDPNLNAEQNLNNNIENIYENLGIYINEFNNPNPNQNENLNDRFFGIVKHILEVGTAYSVYQSTDISSDKLVIDTKAKPNYLNEIVNGLKEKVNGLMEKVYGLKEKISPTAIVTSIDVGAMLYLGYDFINSFYEMNNYYQLLNTYKFG